MTMMPSGEQGMARSLTLWFVYCIVVGVFAGYLTGAALGPGRRIYRSSASPGPSPSPAIHWP
jgi:hypothetical protein